MVIKVVWYRNTSNFHCTDLRRASNISSNQNVMNASFYAAKNGENVSLRKCKEWKYDNKKFSNTIIEQFNLVCAKWFYPNMAQSIFFSGVFVGVFCSGIISDRYGRKTAMFLFLSILIGNQLCLLFCLPS